tara:strand:+ start:351 stop:632 length:282 start_codon:yes stop_codon:yes gene_type:complete
MNKNINNKFFGIDFINIETFFGVATFISLLPQIYKIIKTKSVKDFSIFFILGLLIVNLIFFIIGFIENLPGLMIGSITFVLYNALIIYYHLNS